MSKILVTPRSITKNGHPALELLTQAGHELVFSTPGEQPGEAELIALLPGCAGYLAGVEKVPAHVLESTDTLKVISRNGTGVDNVDIVAAERLGIRVCRAEGANARGVAELAFGLILSLARNISFSDGAIKQDGWARRQGIELENRTLGLIGCGKIGKLVAQFALAFGMRVLAYDLYPDRAFTPAGDFSYAPLETVYTQADIISLHCPPSPDGKPLIDAAVLQQMKRGVLLVNTARAGLIDDAAAIAALQRGDLGGVAVDVFDPEPPTDRALASHDRVIATPHIGGFTSESVSRAVTVAAENLLRYL